MTIQLILVNNDHYPGGITEEDESINANLFITLMRQEIGSVTFYNSILDKTYCNTKFLDKSLRG